MRYISFYLSFFFIVSASFAQRITQDSIRKVINQSASFSTLKDNYFIIGTDPLYPDISHSNVKFQISIKQRFTNAILPFRYYLFITYSQKSIWHIFEESSPFGESNYNPSIGIGKGIIYNGKFCGAGGFSIEHESNGREGVNSRGWNKIMLHYAIPISRQVIAKVNIWKPFFVSVENVDLFHYIGYGEAVFHYQSNNERWAFDLLARKGWAKNWNGYFDAQVAYRLGKKSNQYIGMQWSKGYGETLINYNKSINMIRFGIIIKPNFWDKLY